MSANSVELVAPLTVDATGSFATLSTPDQIAQQHIATLIGTSFGERVMRGDYGTDALGSLFQGLDPTSLAQIKSSITDAITQWAPEVSLVAVDVAVDSSGNSVSVTVRYNLVNGVEKSTTVTTKISAS